MQVYKRWLENVKTFLYMHGVVFAVRMTAPLDGENQNSPPAEGNTCSNITVFLWRRALKRIYEPELVLSFP